MEDGITESASGFKNNSMKKSQLPKKPSASLVPTPSAPQRILEGRQTVFTRRGADASMDEIREAREGCPGTLYRHCPSRDELLATVYITEVEKLSAAQKKCPLNSLPSRPCERGIGLHRFTSRKKDHRPRMKAMTGGPLRGCSADHAGMEKAANALASRAVASGDLRPDVDPMDLLRAIYACRRGSADDWPARSRHSSTYSFKALVPIVALFLSLAGR